MISPSLKSSDTKEFDLTQDNMTSYGTTVLLHEEVRKNVYGLTIKLTFENETDFQDTI